MLPGYDILLFQSGKENFPRDGDGKIIYSDVSIVETWKVLKFLKKKVKQV